MARSEIIQNIAHEKRSARTTNKPASNTTDDNSIVVPMEWQWPDDLQSESKFPISKNLWPHSRFGHVHPSNKDLDSLVNKGWNGYKLADGAEIRGEAIPTKILWHSKDRLDIQFDTVAWWIATPPHLPDKPDTLESHPGRPIQINQSLETQNTYKTNIGADAYQYIVVKLLLREAVWLADIYHDTGKHAYNISYQIDVKQFPDYI